jgi:hypothetical protein
MTGSRSSAPPIFLARSINDDGIAGCRKSKGVTEMSVNPARSRSLRSLPGEKAVSSGETYGKQLLKVLSRKTCGLRRFGAAKLIVPPGFRSLNILVKA